MSGLEQNSMVLISQSRESLSVGNYTELVEDLIEFQNDRMSNVFKALYLVFAPLLSREFRKFQ